MFSFEALEEYQDPLCCEIEAKWKALGLTSLHERVSELFLKALAETQSIGQIKTLNELEMMTRMMKL